MIRLHVIPCSAAKSNHPHPVPARTRYRGSFTTYALERVERIAALEANGGDDAAVRILSARYGLLDPDAPIDDYEQTIPAGCSTDAELDELYTLTAAVRSTLHDHRARHGNPDALELVAWTPKRYTAVLEAAAADSPGWTLLRPFDGTRGIGEQRARIASALTFARSDSFARTGLTLAVRLEEANARLRTVFADGKGRP